MSKPNFSSRSLIIIAIVIAAAIVGLVVLKDKTDKRAVSGTIPTVSTNQKSSSGDSISNNTPKNSPEETKNPGSQSGSSGNLLAPSGTLVSNHKPSLSGDPTPSGEQSVCNTTPGASCYIKFVQGDIVKKLDTRIADSTGSVIWSWDIKQAGFSQGRWTITAVATLNGLSKSTTDNLSLEVQP